MLEIIYVIPNDKCHYDVIMVINSIFLSILKRLIK